MIRILALLDQFLEGKTLTRLEKHPNNPKIIHYYNEIVRYWNKINFIINKTLRSMSHVQKPPSLQMSLYLYITYRIKWENAPNEIILDEIKATDFPLRDEIQLPSFLNRLRTFDWKIALKGKSEEEKMSLVSAIPSFFIQRLSPVMSMETIKANAQKMDELGKVPKIPFQVDKGSRMVIQTLAPEPDEFICDLCAAPGMKTSLISNQVEGKARILAGEFHSARSGEMKQLLRKLHLPNVFLINADGIKFPLRNDFLFDKILLDAPCTGSGTFNSHPELKWRQNEAFLHQNTTIQEKLLQNAIDLLKPGGILIYSTCSLYPEEGELQILKILDKVEPMELVEGVNSSYEIQGQKILGTGRLFPIKHQTQGFFIGKLKKKN